MSSHIGTFGSEPDLSTKVNETTTPRAVFKINNTRKTRPFRAIKIEISCPKVTRLHNCDQLRPK